MTMPQHRHLRVRLFLSGRFLSDSCPSGRETSTRMREQGCLSPSAPSKSSRISTNELDSLPESASALPQQAWGAEARLKPSCMHVDMSFSGVRRVRKLEPKDAPKWSIGKHSGSLGANY